MAGLNIVGVQFRRAGKIYDFAADAHDLRVGDEVVVETERGPSLAKVVRLKYAKSENYQDGSLKPIVRRASEKDIKVSAKLTSDFAEDFTKTRVRELNLDMKVLKAEIQFGGNKVIIYFSAPGRVDFRELVKALAGGLKARVELKQVGARDETKIVGGIGICGREYCCSSFLREFVPVSIKMAKNQNLALNPTKVSGGCGRLLCCLTYENDLYTELRKLLPPRGTRVRTQDGSVGHVVKSDLLNQICDIELSPGNNVTAAVNKLEILEKRAPLAGEEDERNEWGEDIDLSQLID